MKLILAIAASSLMLGSAASAQDYPALQGRPVLDAANVIPQAREDALNARLLEYERTTGHQMAVVTVASLEDYAIEEYSIGLARKLALGNRDADDGILYLIAPNQRQARVEVGLGLEPILTDADTALIQANLGVPAFKTGDYPGGIEAVSSALMEKTQMDMTAIADLRQRQETQRRDREAANAAAFGNFMMTAGIIIGGFIAFGLSVWGLTEPGRRRHRREEEEQMQVLLAQRRERQRLDSIAHQQKLEEARKAADRERRHKAQERQDMLNAMSPVKRNAFLAAEAAALAAAVAADQERQRLQRIADAERRARDRIADEERSARRRREESSYSYGSPSSSSSSSSSDSFGGGGGSFGGGGSTSSW